MSKPTLSKVVHTLLVTDEPLGQSELAERADVSARSIRTHMERLAAFDFVRKTDEGWRFTLPFHTDDERGGDILPWFVATDDNQEQGQQQEQQTLVRDVFAEVVYNLLDSDRYGDPADPVGGALFAKPGERIPALREAWEWLDPWISMIRILLDADNGVYSKSEPAKRTTAMVGDRPQQASLAAKDGGGG